MVSHRLQHDMAEKVLADDVAMGYAQAERARPQAVTAEESPTVRRTCPPLLDLPELRRGRRR